jgi:hypothetical protein
MKARFGPALALVLALGLLAGCGTSGESLTSPAGSGSGTTPAQEEAAVSAVLAVTPELVDDGEFESADEVTMDAGGPGSLSPMRPLRWWRVINDVERRFEFAFADTDTTGRPTKAVVTIHKRLRGTFNVLAKLPPPQDGSGETLSGGDPSPGPRDSLDLVRKRLEDHWVRRVLLHRVRLTPGGQAVWRVVASSGVDVTSRDATTRILSVRVQTASRDTTLEDPLAFWWLRRTLRVSDREPVTLTVDTGRADDVVVLLCRGGRFPFKNNGDGTYTGEWRAPLLPGVRHVGINALSHGTLFDDQAPYDSKAWILPYVVVGTELAEYMP